MPTDASPDDPGPSLVTVGATGAAGDPADPPTPSGLAAVPEDWHRALAIVAHPDDLEYGAASAIARWTAQGKEVAYLLATSGEAGIDGLDPAECGPLRREEERRGAVLVGVHDVAFLDHPDGAIEAGMALRRDFAREIRRRRPDVIITGNHHETFAPGRLNMADHRVVGLAAIDAARDAGNRWIFPELAREGVEPWNGARRILVSGSPEARHAVDVAATLDAGVASLTAHRAYLDGLGDNPMRDPGVFLRDMAEITGWRFGGVPSVAFELLEW